MDRSQYTFRALQITEYSLGESAAGAVRMLLAAELLFHAVLDILRSQFVRWNVDAQFYRTMQCMLVITIVLFGILAPLCGKYRVLAYAGFEVGLLSLGGWYGWKHLEQLEKGIVGLCGDYLLAWNTYYGTNYVVEYDRTEMGRTLGFLVLVLVLVFLILRYVTGVRWLMLLPPLSGLALGLLVDLLAGWKGLACFFAGTLVLYSGSGDQSKILFVPVNHKKLKNRSAAVHFWSIGLVTAAALAVVILSGALFSAPAGKIPEKTPQFMVFQNKLEYWIQNLGNGIHLASSRERLDNSTPVYTNEVILTISADKTPQTNLYLPEFYSGTYRNGSWRLEKREYRRMAADRGLDGDHLGTLLWQMGYEYLSMTPILKNSEQDQMIRQYTIDFGEKRTTSAWVPYFADLSSLQNEVWVEDEGLVKKKWFTDEVSFSGWSSNVDVYGFLAYMDLFEDADSKNDAVDWYSDYVKAHYQGKSGLSAVSEYARELFEAWQWLQEGDIYWNYAAMAGCDVVQIGDWMLYGENLRNTVSSEDPYYMGEDAMTTNVYRLAVAEAVRNQLASGADYNLYLNDIPAGTDTIQYFLETGHEGYCMHFASAGALILQELGIPARYASGYIVKRNAFRGNSAKGVSATVYDRNAHAWVEVYLENIGWVPVEMTPGYESEASELPTDTDKQDELVQRHEERKQQEDSQQKTPNKELQKPAETQDSETEENEPESETQESGGGGTGDGTGAAIPWARIAGLAGLAVLVFALLLAAIYTVRFGIRRYRQALWEEMQKKQNRRAVMRINRRIYRRLQGGGVRPMGHIRLSGGSRKMTWLGITDTEYEQKLARTYSSILLQDWAEYMRIVKKAAFSEETILPQELTFCYQIYQTHRRKKQDKR